MSVGMRRGVLAVMLGLCVVSAVSAQPVAVSRSFDWRTGMLELSLTADVVYDDGTPAAQMFLAEQRAREAFPNILFESLLSIQVDSRSNVGQMMAANPVLADEIVGLAQTARPGLPEPATDLKSITLNYSVPIFPDLARFFVTHNIPFQMSDVIEWVPTRPFTGLVIYAAQPLPLHGTDREVQLEPALLPEIFDTEMRPILEQDMLDPDFAIRWGSVAYAESADETPWMERIGADPLRIMAREFFGVHPTDIVIGADDATRLLSLPENQRLLREGRILVIVSEGQTTGD